MHADQIPLYSLQKLTHDSTASQARPPDQRLPESTTPAWVGALLLILVLSPVRLFVTRATIALQALQSMGFHRQEYWSGLPLPSQKIFLTQVLNPCLLHWKADSLPLSHRELTPLHEGSVKESARDQTLCVL